MKRVLVVVMPLTDLPKLFGKPLLRPWGHDDISLRIKW